MTDFWRWQPEPEREDSLQRRIGDTLKGISGFARQQQRDFERSVQQRVQELGQWAADLNQQAVDTLNQASDAAASGLQGMSDRAAEQLNQWGAPEPPETEARIQANLGAPQEPTAFRVGQQLPQVEAALGEEATTPGTGLEYLTRPVRETVGPIVEGVQRVSSETAGAAQQLGVPEPAANVAGAVVGGLMTQPVGMGQMIQQGAERAGIPGADVQGSIAETIAPTGLLGDVFGLPTKARKVAAGAGALFGAGVGAVAGDENAPGGMPGEMVRGGLTGLQVGAAVPDLAGAARRIGDVGQRARQALGAMGEAATEEAGGVARPGVTYYHGTGSSFGQPDATKFDPNGLYGPAYYVTSEPRVASSYAVERSAPDLESAQQAARYGLELRDTQKALAEQQNRLARLSPEDYRVQQTRAETQGRITRLQARADEWQSLIDRLTAGRKAPQVRPVDVPEGLRLYDVETPIGSDDLQRIAKAAEGVLPDETVTALHGLAADGLPFEAEGLWEGMQPGGQRSIEGARLANTVLARAGFDGIRHPGGRMMPIQDEAGKAIEHTALAIFPESLPKLRNALSGTPGGIMPTPPATGLSTNLGDIARDVLRPPGAAVTGAERAFDVGLAGVGGVGAAATAPEDATWQERLGRGAVGAALGARSGPALRGLGRVAEAGVSAARRGATIPRLSPEQAAQRLRDTTADRRMVETMFALQRRREPDLAAELQWHIGMGESGLAKVEALLAERGLGDALAPPAEAFARAQAPSRGALGIVQGAAGETPTGPPTLNAQGQAARTALIEQYVKYGIPRAKAVQRVDAYIADMAKAGTLPPENVAAPAAPAVAPAPSTSAPSPDAASAKPAPDPWIVKGDDIAGTAGRLNLLVSPLTHLRNISGTAPTVVVSPIESLVAPVFEPLFRRTGSPAEARFAGEAGARYRGLWHAWGSAVANVKTVWGQGDEALQTAQTGRDAPKGRLARGLSKGYRPLTAADAFFRTLAEGEELWAQAYRRARQAGLQGQALEQEMQRLIASPDEMLVQAVHQAGKYHTYTQEMDRVGKLLQETANVLPGSQLIVPFVRTPYNAVKYDLERSPLGVASVVKGRMEGKSSGELADRSARALLGGMVAAALYQYGQQGNIAPPDWPDSPTEVDAWMAEGKRPGTIKLGKWWVDLRLIPGLGANTALVGGAQEFGRAVADKPDAQFDKEAARFGLTLMKALAQKPLLDGISNLMEAIGNPDRAEQWVEKLKASAAAQVIPASSALRYIENITDPWQREARSADERIKAGIPGLAQQLPVRRTAFGEPMRREQTGVEAALNPIRRTLDRSAEGIRRYSGSESAAQDTQIARAIDVVERYRSRPQEFPKPTAAQVSLYNRFKGRENYRWTQLRSAERTRERQEQQARRAG